MNVVSADMLPVIAAAFGVGIGLVRTLFSRDKDAARESLSAEVEALSKLLAQRAIALKECHAARIVLEERVNALEIRLSHAREDRDVT